MKEKPFINKWEIHSVLSGSWSTRKVLSLLDFDSALLGVRATLASILMVYAEQGSPALSKKPEDFFQGEVNQAAWDSLNKEVVDNEDYYEYHIYKVGQNFLSFQRNV